MDSHTVAVSFVSVLLAYCVWSHLGKRQHLNKKLFTSSSFLLYHLESLSLELESPPCRMHPHFLHLPVPITKEARHWSAIRTPSKISIEVCLPTLGISKRL